MWREGVSYGGNDLLKVQCVDTLKDELLKFRVRRDLGKNAALVRAAICGMDFVAR